MEKTLDLANTSLSFPGLDAGLGADEEVALCLNCRAVCTQCYDHCERCVDTCETRWC